MAVIGYARVSTDDQNLDLQTDALKLAGAESIYEEKASGKSTDRTVLKFCLRSLRPGDQLVVWRLDRPGRNLRDLIRIVNELNEREIGFKSLSESIDTSGHTGMLVFHLFGAVAEFERSLIRERTAAGVKAARARGKMGGRPKVLDTRMARSAGIAMLNRDLLVSDLVAQFRVSRSTLYNLAKPGEGF
ncbi:DNA invertase [Herbaspirillum sp. meg3]|uniref:recombinase family protein n=1 Tax=Herbaspirillum sp. meg3 TaxID=2025949 RepID=UPI000B98DF0B|nr:recombinase family protein [Herbaspirillum sp. meg3]ASU39124.1 DNA invertase [Herbaspirillum sp. meg3]